VVGVRAAGGAGVAEQPDEHVAEEVAQQLLSFIFSARREPSSLRPVAELGAGPRRLAGGTVKADSLGRRASGRNSGLTCGGHRMGSRKRGYRPAGPRGSTQPARDCKPRRRPFKPPARRFPGRAGRPARNIPALHGRSALNNSSRVRLCARRPAGRGASARLSPKNTAPIPASTVRVVARSSALPSPRWTRNKRSDALALLPQQTGEILNAQVVLPRQLAAHHHDGQPLHSSSDSFAFHAVICLCRASISARAASAASASSSGRIRTMYAAMSSAEARFLFDDAVEEPYAAVEEPAFCVSICLSLRLCPARRLARAGDHGRGIAGCPLGAIVERPVAVPDQQRVHGERHVADRFRVVHFGA